jgi:hypothetical protein
MATAVVEGVAEMTPAMIEQQALTTVERAKALVVRSVEDRGVAAEYGRAIVALDKEVEAFFKPMKEAAAKAHKEICTKENSVRKPLDEAKRYLSGQIGNFDAEAERERRAEEARIQERLRLEAEADAKRRADEQALADAIELEAQGDKKGAEAVLNNPMPLPVHVPAVVLPTQVPKAEGVSRSTAWKFRITDESLIPREYLIVDEKTIGQIVRAQMGKTKIPGIEVYPDHGARFRA